VTADYWVRPSAPAGGMSPTQQHPEVKQENRIAHPTSTDNRHTPASHNTPRQDNNIQNLQSHTQPHRCEGQGAKDRQPAPATSPNPVTEPAPEIHGPPPSLNQALRWILRRTRHPHTPPQSETRRPVPYSTTGPGCPSKGLGRLRLGYFVSYLSHSEPILYAPSYQSHI
jgi:hypothetical protein